MRFNTRILIGIAFVLLLLLLRFSGVTNYLTLANLKEQRLDLMKFVDSHYFWAVLIYISWYISIVVVALPIAALSTVAGGFLFGVFPAVIYANIGATIGATLFFLLVRYAFVSALQNRYARHMQWVHTEMELHGIAYLLAIRFIAIIPFFIMNALIALTNISVWTFAWTTSVGIIPGTAVYAFAGQQLTTIDSLRDIFSPTVLIAFLLLATLAVVPLLAKKYGWFGMGK